MRNVGQYSVSNLLVATAVVAILVGWAYDRYHLVRKVRMLESIIDNTEAIDEIQTFLDEQDQMAHPVIIKVLPKTED